MISFSTGRENTILIGKILDRLEEELPEAIWEDRISLVMDLSACHANGCPLDFQKLLDFDHMNLAHDVCGIQKHLSRSTGKLLNHFIPRCAIKSA